MSICDTQEKLKSIFGKKYPGIYSIHEITPNIFITSTSNISTENLDVYGVKQILNFGTPYESDICLNYKLNEKYAPLDLFKLSYDFCDKATRNNKRVLITCDSGMDICCTGVISFLLRRAYLLKFADTQGNANEVKELLEDKCLLINVSEMLKALRPCAELSDYSINVLSIYENMIKSWYKELFENKTSPLLKILEKPEE